MDTLYTPDFYRAYEHLVGLPIEDQLSKLRSMTESLIENSKETGYRKGYYKAIAICLLPLLVVSAACYIIQGPHALLAPVFLSLLVAFYRNSRIGKATANIQKPNTDMGDYQVVENLIRYLRHGISLKHLRVDSLLLQFCLFFPWVLVLLGVWVFNMPDKAFTLVGWVLLAYATAAPVWYYVFSREKTYLSEIDQQAALLESQFYKLSR